MTQFFDNGLFAQNFAGPGQDTRQWCSYALVQPDTPDAPSVQFTKEFGPLVHVKLAPSGIPCVARVAGGVAGNGEADYFPFQPGDECVALVCEGSEEHVVIVGRLNQEIDVWPTLVGGLDVTKNTVAFRRLRTPYVLETAASFALRSALTGANITIDATGNLVMSSGDKHQVVLRSDFAKFSLGDGSAFVQLDASTRELLLQGGGTTQLALGASASSFLSTGTLSIGTSGGVVMGHAVTVEQTIVFLQAFGTALAAAAAVWPPTPAQIIAALEVAIPSSLAVPFTPYQAPLLAALTLMVPDPTGTLPGLARAGLTY